MKPDEPIARPGQSLDKHLLEVGRLCKGFAEPIGLSKAGDLIGSGHDEAKVSPHFQNYILSATGLLDQEDADWVDAAGLRGHIDHSTAGAQKLWRAVTAATPPQDRLFAQILCLCMFSHHSGLADCLAPDGRASFNDRINKNESTTHLNTVLKAFGPKFGPPDQDPWPQVLEEMRGRFSRIIRPPRSVLCELCRDRCEICGIPNPEAWFSLGLMTRMLFSCLLDADRIDSADAEKPENMALRSKSPPVWTVLDERLTEKLLSLPGTETIDGLRNTISNHCRERASDAKGVYTLTVPTGGGKTLASLRFALGHAERHRMDRIINIIPFTTIIDQNAKVVRGILEQGQEPGSVVLEHHSNLDPDKQTQRARLAAECWDAPVIYTTMVQFLECLFGGGTRGARRMHRLTNAVLIFDEIQTLPVNCAHLFCHAVNFLVRECGASVVLCTATQPLLGRLPDPERGVLNLEPERELMPDVDGLFADLKRVEILNRTQPGGWSAAEVADLAVAQCRETGSCLVVVNTKKWAQTLYEECSERDATGLYHLSTDMCPGHRLKVIEEMGSRLPHERVLCVSTQLIEAGVDISFGSAIRLLAGMDSILQAAGRCNRNKENPCGQVFIVDANHEGLNRLPEIREAKECARRVLADFLEDPDSLGGKLTHPKVIERYFEYFFFQRRKVMSYPVKDQQTGLEDTLLNLISCNPNNPGNLGFKPSLRQSFATAGRLFKVIDAPTEGVIVPYGDGQEVISALCSVFHPAELGRLLRRAQPYSVNLFPNVLETLKKAHAVHETQSGSGVLYLDKRYYSEQFGVCTYPINEMETLDF